MRHFHIALYDADEREVPIPAAYAAMRPFRSHTEAVVVGRAIRAGYFSAGHAVGLVVFGPEGVAHSEHLRDDV